MKEIVKKSAVIIAVIFLLANQLLCVNSTNAFPEYGKETSTESLVTQVAEHSSEEPSLVLKEKTLPTLLAPNVINCITYPGSNVNSQDYLVWSETVKSYLTQSDSQTIMRVQGNTSTGILVEYYDMSYNLLSTKIVAKELPIFGGFYETASNYYIISGQENLSQSAATEVVRVTKYDKSWKKIGIASLSDCNTVSPFYAGSLRVVQYGNYLIVRTSHTMYKTADGYNHQANMTFQVDTAAAPMTITDKQYPVCNIGMGGYVSHSFNQFIDLEGNKLVAVDHGDAYPRSIVLIKYSKDVSTGQFNSSCTNTDIITFPGTIGDNATGASVGAFEISGTSYLIAGNSGAQDAEYAYKPTRNVYVASVSKTTSAVTMNWITDFSEGTTTTTTPQMVKIAADSYLLMWSQEDKVSYTQINGSGARVGPIYSFTGELSDCVPIVTAGKIIWYTWTDETMKFYEINTANLAVNNVETINNGHTYVNTGVVDGYAHLVCSKCQATDNILVPTSINLGWNKTGGSTFYGDFSQTLNVGEKLYFYQGYFSTTPTGANPELKVTVSNTNVITYTESGHVFNMVGKGTSKIRVESKYNPDCYYEYTIKVLDPNDPTPDVSYRTHVQDVGWQDYQSNGAMSGTSGQSLRLEGININVTGNSNLGVQYTTHVQDYEWMPWSANDEMSGTEGESKRLEAIKIQLTGADKDLYDIYYRVHAQDFGWLDWASNGAAAGTAGFSKRLEAIEIIVVEKGSGAPGLTARPYVANGGTEEAAGAAASNVAYQTHIQNVGWQGIKYNQQMSGTSGKSYRLEGIKIKLTNQQYSGGIVYTTHVQDIGWQENKSNGEMSGTSGQSLRLEAIKIQLTGEMANQYDVYYRVHIQDFGWLGWAKNGEESGSEGLSKRLEGIEVVLVKKGGAAPGTTDNTYIK